MEKINFCPSLPGTARMTNLAQKQYQNRNRLNPNDTVGYLMDSRNGESLEWVAVVLPEQ